MSLFMIDTKGGNEETDNLLFSDDSNAESGTESEEDSDHFSSGPSGQPRLHCVAEEEDDECIILPPMSGCESEDDDTVITEIPKLTINVADEEEKRKKKKKKKKDDISFDDAYLDPEKKEVTESLGEERRSNLQKKISEKSLAMRPGLEQLETVPNNNLSDHKLRKMRREERAKTKGKDWYNLPATEVTEEVKRDLEVLQMRSVLDPKTFYKKNDLKVLPKFFQIGTVQDNAADFYHSRIPKKERKRTLVDELLADAEFQKRSKQKFKEIVAEKEKTLPRAHRHAKRLKKRKT